MKNINKIFSLAFVALVTSVAFTSCEDEDKARFPELTNGGFVKFVSLPEFNAGADPTTASFDMAVEDPNENAALYEIRVLGNFTGASEDTLSFRSTTTFPFDIGFTGADMATLFSVPVSTFETGDSFEFFADVTTVDGIVYDGAASSFISPTNNGDLQPGDAGYIDPLSPEFVPEPGMWNGANSDGIVLVSTPSLLAAFNWEVTFEDPEED
ncbi:hypothetical protein ULMS_11300 [Patiriisocius marinistellae]|uniref:Uncharacterized protein n=1 Tax=Patiriisocius marinistellae TaxID=2494560 RepID=A0A5J4FWR2_9FLAO|nr:hypothetical protein [Patiriisocius marinistellae]GEQ85622.1 hypothetical protein ULMS_11300 [Patiriisocius marinistellae]